jgi:chromosome segregation ATPase
LGEEGSVCVLHISRGSFFYDVPITRLAFQGASQMMIGEQQEAEQIVDREITSLRREMSIIVATQEVETRELKRMLDDSNRRLQDREKTVQERDETVRSSQTLLAARNAEIARLATAKTEMDSVLQSLTNSHRRSTSELQHEIVALKLALKHAQDLAVARELQLKSSDCETQRLRTSATELRLSNETLTRERHSLQQQLAASKNSLTAQAQNLAALSSAHAQVQVTVDQLEKAHARSGEEVTAAAAQIAAMKEMQVTLEAQLSASKEAAALQAAAVTRLEAIVRERARDVEQAEAELRAARSDLVEMQASITCVSCLVFTV